MKWVKMTTVTVKEKEANRSKPRYLLSRSARHQKNASQEPEHLGSVFTLLLRNAGQMAASPSF